MTKKNNPELNTSLLDVVENTDGNSAVNPADNATPAVAASTQLMQYVNQGVANIHYCLNGISPYLPTKTQLAMTALVFQAGLNALPMLVAEIIIEDEIRGDAKASLLEIVAPAIAIMLAFAPAEAIQTYLHSTWRAINDHEPDIASMGARSLTWVLTLLLPSLVSSFVSGALTAKAGFSDPKMQAFMAVLLGTANMIKTLLGSIIPEWRILAHIKQLAPLNMQPIVERLFQPDILDFFKTLYAKLAPPIMGAVYANFVYAEVIDNVPEAWPLGIILALFVLQSCAETTKDFDVMQVVESCEAFAKALAEAHTLAATATENAQILALEEGAAMNDTPGVVETEDTHATNYSLTAIVQTVRNTVSPCVTAITPYASAGYQALSPCTTLLSKFADEISGKFVVDTMHHRGMSTESIAQTMAAGLFIATYCIVTQAIHEYVLNDEGTATLGAKYLGTGKTAAASDTVAATVVIAAIAILLASIQALSKYPFMKEILEKRFQTAPNDGTVIIMDSVTPPLLLTTGVNPITIEPTLETDTVPRLSDETKTTLEG